MSLCARTVLQTGRRQVFSKPAYLYLKRQLATEVQSHETASSTPPPPPPPQAQTATPPAVEDVTAGAPPQAPKPTGGRKRPRPTRHADGKVINTTIERLPFRCYQAALRVLEEDRVEKLAAIKEQTKSIEGLKRLHKLPDDNPRIKKMQAFVDELKLNIDKNNPRIKYNYENNVATRDLHRPIYQYWDDQAWRSYRRKVLMQRMEQMFIVPDILPKIDPIVDVHMKFKRHRLELGEKMAAKDVMHHPSVQVKQFDSKERLVTVLVVDPDKPNLEKNGFDFYLQWMVTNCQLSIESPMLIGKDFSREQQDEVAPYEVPYVHKGEKYHRYCVFVLEQEGKLEIGKKAESSTKTEPSSSEGATAVTAPAKPTGERIQRLGFNLRSFIAKNNLKVIGSHLWRCEFDDSMIEVMKKLGRTDWNMKYVKHPEHI
ncbi:hypothetical protein H072_3550 [Dactylellina haptotyla CBS 200.50]|uniref:Uncharacterized protein n=1 Tax=Dactylellina haptotyla (strain CBS 200.50) TaxID=1284197 RepID=S8C434_DACHA|nr:hypothetical protein H072_3550 [Dactylellina haptotyla CBS 200.50]